jgi:hypothetical protein
MLNSFTSFNSLGLACSNMPAVHVHCDTNVREFWDALGAPPAQPAAPAAASRKDENHE